ncbi:MAG TPA: DUF1003 domain-containing protein [Draconibacterium sp.]|nr:DUF1003 domain-containing protein [Draconibacterium sp.]
MNEETNNQTCRDCGKPKKNEELFPAELIRPSIARLIKKDHPEWDYKSSICLDDLNRYRSIYLRQLMKVGKGETKSLEKDEKKSLEEYELISENINDAYDERLNFGDRLADKIASFGGSWKFIIIFGAVLLIWIGINSWLLLMKKPFDPYPFILLNLILSCLAAIQAPIIMMSQNRHAAKDKLKADNEYKINLKAELEIRHINDKIDFLLLKQWQRLLEIQQFQTELMEEISRTGKEPKKSTKQ